MTAAANTPGAMRGVSAIQLLGRKLDSIPFSPYHIGLILVLGLVGFVEGYDLALGGSLIVLAKGPLHLTGADIKWLVLGPTLLVALAGIGASLLSDRLSRKAVMQIGVIVSTFFTLLIPLAQIGRPADRAAPADRHRPGLCDLGAVPDRRRADAGPAPPHLRRDLRSHAGQRLYPAAVYRLRFGRQRARLPVDRLAGRARPVRRPGAAAISPFPTARAGCCAAAGRKRRSTTSTTSSGAPAAGCRR